MVVIIMKKYIIIIKEHENKKHYWSLKDCIPFKWLAKIIASFLRKKYAVVEIKEIEDKTL